jgi:hypothetical protein
MRMRISMLAVAAVLGSLATAAGASAAAKPTVATGGHSALTPTSVTLLGKVNPQGTSTSYYFQYGTSKAYGIQTGPVAAGVGKTAVNASAAITGLAPNTTYHYRVVGVNIAGGTTLGGDVAFTTLKQPLGLSLLATPNPALFMGPTTVSATLTGTGNASRTIVLKQRPFPYTAPFVQVGNAVVTTSAGVATFPILSILTNTQYLATVSGTSTNSPPMLVAVAVNVHLALHSHHVHARSLATFSGTVSPKEDGAQYAIQKLRGTTWVNVAGSSLKHSSDSSSKFLKHVRIAHSGTYRVFVGVADGAHTSQSSGAIKLTVVSSHHR